MLKWYECGGDGHDVVMKLRDDAVTGGDTDFVKQYSNNVIDRSDFT